MLVLGTVDLEEATHPPPLPLTPRMTAVLLLAKREAELLGHSAVGAEHILLALLWEGQGLAAQVMHDLDASEATRAAVRTRMQSTAYVPGSVSADQLVSKAKDEALLRGDHHIGTEHYLLAMTRAGGIVTAAFEELGVSSDILEKTQMLLQRSDRPASSNY